MNRWVPYVLISLPMVTGSLYKKEIVNHHHGLYRIANHVQFVKTKTNIECGSICQAWESHELNSGNSPCRAFKITDDGICHLFQVWSLEASLVEYPSMREVFMKLDEDLGNSKSYSVLYKNKNLNVA